MKIKPLNSKIENRDRATPRTEDVLSRIVEKVESLERQMSKLRMTEPRNESDRRRQMPKTNGIKRRSNVITVERLDIVDQNVQPTGRRSVWTKERTEVPDSRETR